MTAKIKLIGTLFLLGFAGVLSTLPLLTQLVSAQAEQPPVPIVVVQLAALAQTSLILLFALWLGAVFSSKVGLHAPLISARLRGEQIRHPFTSMLKPALLGGITGGVAIVLFSGVMMEHLPPAFIQAAQNFTPPWYTRLLYGGITEELLMRWGLMSFLVWASYRITQRLGSEVRSYNFVLAIVLSAVIFAVGHLPIAFSLSPQVTAPLLIYILVGNTFFGLIAGYLYWKRGLECAMLAHMLAHLTMLAGELVTTG